MRKSIILLSIISLLSSTVCKAQTNVQLLYDFGSDKQFITATVEGSYFDSWGSTYFFVDHDFNTVNKNSLTYSPGASYMEISRSLNFWQNTAAAPLSLHLEYNGGHELSLSYQNAFLAGIEYGFSKPDNNAFINLQLLYKYISYKDKNARSAIPLQFTAVWGMNELFGLKGLEFGGFVDFWWEDQDILFDHFGAMLPEKASFVVLSEVQLWYNLGRHFGCDNLSLGGEVEFAWNFEAKKGFWCRPAGGLRWIF